MTTAFGPWATAIQAAGRERLSTHWKNRMRSLSSVSTAGGVTRRQVLGAAAAALALWPLPTLTALADDDEPPRDRGPISELPEEDGAWAEYQVSAERTRNGQTTTREFKVRVASVGQKQVNGKPARWIEFTLQREQEPALKTKLLIPEEAFRGEQTPLDAAVAGWSQRGDDPPRQIDDPRERGRGSPLNMLMPGKLTNAGRLEERTFEIKPAEKVAAAGRSGRARFADNTGSDELDYRIWSSPKVPFGLVLAEVNEISPDRQADRRLTQRLTDFGRGAKSTLPE